MAEAASPEVAPRPAQGPGGAAPNLQQMSERDRQRAEELAAAAAWTLARQAQLVRQGRIERARDMLQDIAGQLRGRAAGSDVLRETALQVEERLAHLNSILGQQSPGVTTVDSGTLGANVQEYHAEARKHFADGQRYMEDGRFEDALDPLKVDVGDPS